jgi:3-dehydroquinate synthase
LLDAASGERVLKLLEALGFELFSGELLHADTQSSLQVINGLEEFREHLGGELTITLLGGIGRGVEVHDMKVPFVVKAIEELQERHRLRPPQISCAAG